MPRKRRCCPPDLPVHVVQRGNNRQLCFADDAHLNAYAQWLRDVAEKYGVEMHAWFFVTNHVHLLVTPSSADFDGDGLVDLATAHVLSDDIFIDLNQGGGVFAANAAVVDSADITVGDLDGDGDIDLATANNLTGDVSVTLNAWGRQLRRYQRGCRFERGAGLVPADSHRHRIPRRKRGSRPRHGE